MASELLKSAIADAKAVRQTALANAKASLEEAFNSKVSSVLSAKLKEEVMDEETSDETYGVPTGKGSTIGTSDNKKPNKPGVTSNANQDKGQEVETWKEDISTEEPATGEHHGNSEEEDTFSDKELDEILAELENSVDGDGASAPVAPALSPDGVPSNVAPTEPVAPTAPTTPATQVTPEVPDDATAPVNPEAPAPAPTGTEDEEISLQEILDALNEEAKDDTDTEAEDEKYADGKAREDDKEEVDETAKLKKDLSEHRKTIEFLRTTLQEVNLLNAKLLYTNKLFKANSLNNAQKMKIIETFDLTKSIREVKLMYATLSESYNTSGKSLTKKTLVKQNIAEGFASKTVGTTKPSDTIVKPEVSEMALRFQTLAGIKK